MNGYASPQAGQPVQSGQAGRPVQTGQPGQPVQSGQPAQPGQPGQPVQSGQPVQPVSSFGQAQSLQQAEQMIRQAQALQAQEQLTRMGVSNVSQQLNSTEQILHEVMRDLQHAQNQLQTQMDAQKRQIASTMQKIEQAVNQFRAVENIVLNRQSPSPLQ